MGGSYEEQSFGNGASCYLNYARSDARAGFDAVRLILLPEDEVRIIAQKFPEMHGTPCAHCVDLCAQRGQNNQAGPVRHRLLLRLGWGLRAREEMTHG